MRTFIAPILVLLLGGSLAAQQSSHERSVDSSSALGLEARRTCLPGILDQATGKCLGASSMPTNGLLFPYPGISNTFGYRAFVGGGGFNQATHAWATVAGGFTNSATGGNCTVGGGAANTATIFGATVAGGYNNVADGIGPTVAGGSQHTAAGDFSTVAGGKGNTADGLLSTVAGGFLNTARGANSFAAGRQALADHNGAFVWGDSQNTALKRSSARDEFNVYASGGARFFSDSGATTGVRLAPGAGSWTSVSDRAAKENVEPVDCRAVLERVLELPITTWNFRSQPESIRHMGPMAQDFYAAFALGLGDETIDTIDPDGVTLAALQGLHALVEEKDAKIAALEARMQRLEAVILGSETTR